MSDKKNVLIFFSFKKHKTGYYKTLFNPLKEVEDMYDLSLHQGSLKDLYIEVIDNKLLVTESVTGKTLDMFDFIRFELWLKSPQQALAAATYLDRNNIPFSGHEALNVLCTTKIGELVRMSDGSLPLPRTFMSSYTGTLDRFKQNDIPFEYPFIAKAADSFGGKMNYLVHNYKELKDALSAHKDQFFVLQEFIPNEFDYRVLVMDNEISFVLKRARSDAKSHLNNTSAGAEGVFVPVEELSPRMQQDALRAAALTLRSDFAGVDLIVNSETGKHAILEVNEAPAIQTGENPPFKINALMAHIKEMVNRK
ncbi:MAG: ATP-grasp domain-containing protein [Candidatus Microsaccharimonas sp.]